MNWQTVQTAQGPQQAIWVDVFKVGASVFVGDQEIELTPELIGEVMVNFRRLSTGDNTFRPPIQRQHNTQTGMQEGDVHDLRVSGGFLQALVTFADPEVREAYNRGQVRFFSPGFSINFQDPHTGEEVGAVLLELSFVSEPQQKNLRDPLEINPGVTLAAKEVPEMADEQTELAGEEEEVFDAQQAFTGLEERFAKLEAAFAALQGEEEEEEEMAAPDAEKAALAARVSELEDDKARLELSVYDVSTEQVDRLVALKRTDVILFSSLVGDLPKRKVAGVAVQPEIGAMGSAAVGGKRTPQEILNEAAEQGIRPGMPGAKFSFWMAANYPGRQAEVIQFAKNNNRA